MWFLKHAQKGTREKGILFLICILEALEEEAEASEQLMMMETIASGEVKEKKKNMLYNLSVELEIPGIQKKIVLNAILDTGATTCVVDSESVPSEALEENTYTVQFNGINSQSKANKKLRGGKMYIGDNWFRIPYTYSFPFRLGGRIQMIIGCNFIRSMYGGVRIEGDNVTFYKNVITIQTRQSVNPVEAEVDDDFLIDHYYDPTEEWNAIGVAPRILFAYKYLETECKLEAVARSAVSDNHQSDKLPEVYQQTQELKEIDNELFDVVMLMRLYHY